MKRNFSELLPGDKFTLAGDNLVYVRLKADLRTGDANAVRLYNGVTVFFDENTKINCYSRDLETLSNLGLH